MKSCAGILLGLWSKSPSCSFTEQLLYLLSCEWLLLIIYLINKCKQKTRHVKNQIIIHHIFGRKFKATSLVKLLPFFSNVCSVLYLARSKSRMHCSIALNFSAVTQINVDQKDVCFFLNYL